MPNDILAQKEIKEILDYNPDTGEFRWLISPSTNVSIGDIAGCNKRGYISIRRNRKTYYAHRLAWVIMTGEWPEHQIDHINHNPSDNRWCNLREATNQENHKNQSLRKDSKSGVCGVIWRKKTQKWSAQIKIHKQIHLGVFTDKFEAICARKSAENKFGYHSNHGS